MLFYDIVITFGDEVERIWKQRFTGATVLWFLVSANLPLPPLRGFDLDLPDLCASLIGTRIATCRLSATSSSSFVRV